MQHLTKRVFELTSIKTWSEGTSTKSSDKGILQGANVTYNRRKLVDIETSNLTKLVDR